MAKGCVDGCCCAVGCCCAGWVWALKDMGCIVIAATAENEIIAANIYAISVLFI
jgi:hypothetical protein